jgi:hypothetical protein
MALAQYTDTFWFPNGSPAVNIAVQVFPRNSSIPATLYTDATGTTQIVSPATSGTGGLSFWAESGDYWVHLDTETFYVTVGMSQEQADLSTGVASGGEISVNALNPSAVDITEMDGYIVDYIAGNQAEPVITRVKTPAQTIPMDAAALARAVTWWVADSSGNIIQQAGKPDPVQRRTHIMLGVTAHTGGVIGVDQTLPVILPWVGNQLVDLMDALGPFSVSGNVITANGANRMLNHSAGTMFARAFNHYSSGVLTRNPHISTTQAQTPATFIQITGSATTAPALTQTVDVANWDNAGVITPVGGGTNASTILRVFLFANSNANFQLIIQYGQATYSSLSAAVNAIGAAPFVVNPTFNPGTGTLIAWIAVTRTATNLSDITQAVIVAAAKFATP